MEVVALPPPEMDMAVVVDLEAKAAAIMVEVEGMGEVAVVNPEEDMEGAKVVAEAMEEVKGAMEAAATTCDFGSRGGYGGNNGGGYDSGSKGNHRRLGGSIRNVTV